MLKPTLSIMLLNLDGAATDVQILSYTMLTKLVLGLKMKFSTSLKSQNKTLYSVRLDSLWKRPALKLRIQLKSHLLTYAAAMLITNGPAGKL